MFHLISIKFLVIFPRDISAPCGSTKDEKNRASWSETVLMGPFSEIRTKRPRHVDLRTKKTAPRGSIKDEKDRASWCESGADGSL